MGQVHVAVVGSDISTLSNEWLFEQIGIADGAWQVRPGAADATGDEQWGLVLSAREIARFGSFAAHNGQWMDARLTKRARLTQRRRNHSRSSP